MGIQKLHKLYRVRGVVYMDESEDVVNITEEIEPSKEQIKNMKSQITKEKNKILKLFSSVDKKTQKIVNPLIDNAAYMKCELKRLKDYNIEHGVKEYYKNGKSQFGFKESVESKTYNTMIKNYLSTIKQLNDYLPVTSKIDPNDEDDDFDDFCNGG